MNPPRLLILKSLLEPSRNAQNTLDMVKEKLPTTDSGSVELRGLFVLMISALEIMLTDTCIYYWRWFPESFDFKETKFSKDDILSANLAVDLIAQQVEKNAISQAYESFAEHLKSFMKTVGITAPPLDQDMLDRIVEAKETRNLLLHNNLRVNRRYVLRAGPCRRPANEGEPLPLSRNYVCQACNDLTCLLGELDGRMRRTYASYTRLAAMRRLWGYLFTSPIMAFEDFWVTDEAADKIVALKISPIENQLSSSELAFLGIWRVHFNRREQSRDAATMYGLDIDHQRKMIWFLATIPDFDLR